MRICLFEDLGVFDLEPLTFTRPVFDLLCGAGSLGQKQGESATDQSIQAPGQSLACYQRRWDWWNRSFEGQKHIC